MNKKNFLIIALITLLLGTSLSQAIGKFNNENNENFDTKIRCLMRRANQPSISVCIIKNNTMVWSNGYGFYNRCILVLLWNWKEPTNSTQYLIGSISKTFTATAMMQIIENESYGVDLDDDVNNYLDFSLRNPKYSDVPITFEMLLSHRSSLIMDETFNSSNFPMSISKTMKVIFKVLKVINSVGDALKIVLDNKSSFYEPNLWNDYPPGEHGNYSNLGYIVLGYLIERITSLTYEEYLQKNILDPLGMNNTTCHPDKKYEMAVPTSKIAGLYIPFPHYDFYFSIPCANIRSTTEDLSKLLIVHMNNGTYKEIKILEKETVENMHKPRGKIFVFQYGLGWMIINNSSLGPLEGHAGDTPGGGGSMFYRVSDKIGYIMFYNQFRYLNPSISDSEWRGKIIDLLFEKAKEL